MSHEKIGSSARALRVTDRDGDSVEFELGVSGHMYVTINTKCVVLNKDDLRAMLELIRDNI